MRTNITILCFLAFIFSNCTNTGSKQWEGECVNVHDIGTIEIIPSLDLNVLRVMFKVETAKTLDSYIRYWEDTGTDSIPANSLFNYSPLCNNMKNHELMIVNLKPDTKYKFNVVIQDEVCKTFSKIYEFSTFSLPAWLPEYPIPDSVSNVNFDGYVHFHSRRKPGYMYLVNDQGKVVWYKSTPFNIKVSKFTKESTFLTILSNDTLKFSSGRQIAEIDLFGQLLYHYDADENETDLTFHHEICYDKQGNILTLTYDEQVVDLSEIGGNVNDTIRGDGILIMDKQDNIVWEWSVFDVMNPIEYQNILNEKNDWLHANALCQDSVGNFIISFRNNSQIWKVDKETGKVIWKLGGDDGDFGLADSLKFYGQHNVRCNKQGHLTLLDNGNKLVKRGLVKSLRKAGTYRKKYRDAKMEFKSRQLTFEIDEKNMKVKLVNEVCFPSTYFTNSQGSSEYINENLVLFCSTNSHNIVFANKQGVKLGSIPLQYESYRAQYISELYETDYVK